MECLNCKTTNEPDSRTCGSSGSLFKMCVTCAVSLESDALYCRRCGNLANQPPEHRAAAVVEVAGLDATSTVDFDSDADLATKITPRRGARIGRPRHLKWTALYGVAVLLSVAASSAVVVTWRGTGAPSTEAAQQAEAFRADLEECKRMVVETKAADRSAILQGIGLVLAKTRRDHTD